MKIGIVGLGTMGEIFLRGMQQNEAIKDGEFFVFDKSAEKLEFCVQNYSVTASKDELDCAAKSQIVFLCVKPKDFAECLKKMAPVMRAPKILVSIAAGVRMASMKEWAKSFDRVVRVMPNTPCLVQEGAMIACPSPTLSKDDVALVLDLIKPMGWSALIQNEELMDIATAVGGSGPAYIYYVAEWMINAAERHGMSPDLSRQFVVQVIKGAAHLMQSSGEPMKDMIAAVKTPQGTTEAAFQILEKQDVGPSLAGAIDQAVQRGRELAGKIS